MHRKSFGLTLVTVCLATSTAVGSGFASAAANVIEEILVTAQKREQSLQEVPISLAVVTGEELEARQIAHTRGLFDISPSLTFTDAFSSTAISIGMRGVSSLSIEGGLQPSVTMLVDDVPLARNGEFTADLVDIDRIEILRGPQGTLIGKNATAGAISIVTKRPADEFEVDVSVTITEDNEQLYKGAIGGPLTDSVRYRVNGFYRDLDDFLDNINDAGVGPNKIGGIESWGTRGQLEIDFTENLNLLLAADYREFDGRTANHNVIIPRTGDTARHISELGYVPGNGVDVFNIDTEPRVEDIGWGVSADLTWQLNDRFTLRSISAYREYENDSEVDVDTTPFGTTAGVVLQSFGLFGELPKPALQMDYFTTELRLQADFDRASVTAGFFYNDVSEDSFANGTMFAIPAFGIVNAATPFDGLSENTSWAVFVDTTIDLTEDLQIFGGLRYTDEEIDYDLWNSPGGVIAPITFAPDGSLDRGATLADVVAIYEALLAARTTIVDGSVPEDKVTGRVGLRYELAENVSAYASYSTGFKGAGVSLAFTAVADPASATVLSESAKAYELGLKGIFLDGALHLNLAVFAQEVNDLQAAQLIPGTITQELRNAGTLESAGVELDFLTVLSEGLTISGGLAYIDAELKDLGVACYPGQTYSTGCVTGPDTASVDTSSPTGFLQSGQDPDGAPPPATPELKFNLAANYNWVLADLPFDAFVNVGFTWSDSFGTRLGDDPLIEVESYHALDVTLGLTDDEGRWRAEIFGKNITDQFRYSNKFQVNSLIGRANGYITRDAYAYYGLRLSANL